MASGGTRPAGFAFNFKKEKEQQMNHLLLFLPSNLFKLSQQPEAAFNVVGFFSVNEQGTDCIRSPAVFKFS